MFERPCLRTLKNRTLEPRGFIQVVTGPRQVGKTTMVGQLINTSGLEDIPVLSDSLTTNNAGRLISGIHLLKQPFRGMC